MKYKVFQNDRQLTTKQCRTFPKPYNSEAYMEYVMVDAENASELVIECETEIKSAVIRPLHSKIPFEVKDGKLAVKVEKPFKASIEINGSSENNLMIFAHVKPCFVPPDYGNVIVIGRGTERKGTLRITEDNTTLYLEEDAVINGNIIAENCENLTICGYGRICMESYTYEMRKDFARSVDIIGCRNVNISGIIIDDSNDWSMRINGCENVEISDVKIFGCRGNSDGIDVCGSRNVTVSDIFTRVWDDSFVVKSLGTGNTENIVFKDSVLWNDFARPMEVGVELRADRVRNIRFENIDIIHSSTGYPLMGIHHGDHAEVSDIVFNDIRIEDTPGAQLFDIRIADSVWSRDNAMGSIREITFSNIDYIGTDGNDILLSNSRIEGFSEEHNVKNVNFHNIRIKGKKAVTLQELGLDICGFAENISITSDLDNEEALKLTSELYISEKFKLCENGSYRGSVIVKLTNNSKMRMVGNANLAVSPKNTADTHELKYNLLPNESEEYKLDITLQAGKYVFYLKNENNAIENKWLYIELDAVIYEDNVIEKSPVYRFVNYYNNTCGGVRLAVSDNELIIKSEVYGETDFTLYTVMPAEKQDGEVLFTAEETDFGEVCAVVKKGNMFAAAPQLRCPAEITYVFRNEPKVGEIVKTSIRLQKDEIIKLPFNTLGIDMGAKNFLLEIEAKTEETKNLRYPFTLFHSTMPDKTAHMFGNIKLV